MSSTPYSSPAIQYQLKVYPVERTCLFELTSGNGLQQVAKLQYPPHLSHLYRQWQDAYLRFYQQLNAQLEREASREGNSDSTSSSPSLRGRVAEEDNSNAGALPPMPQDWRSKLVKAEAELTSEFDRWLRSGELFEIRNELVHQKWYPLEDSMAGEERIVDLLITCGSVELARLPWEAWEIGTELGTKGRIRIARTSPNIRSPGNYQPIKRSHTRILAIFGDDTGLDFEAEQKAVSALSKRFYLKPIVWKQNKSIAQLKSDIRSALQNPEGWDVLLFFGHSNETNLTGGEIAIAPRTAIQISEIAGDLTIARERGLQFALFNSCSGLKIADSLIDLGFPQVAVMREPIHNKVAQEFLVYFLQGLAGYKDAHDALIFACEALKLKQNLTYPSAPFIPSLFRHPNAQLFRLKPRGWKTALRQLLPSKCEAIALPILLLLSCYLPLHDELLARRLLVQSVYRDRTSQIEPNASAPPPVLLVQIDQESIQRAKIPNPRPMSRPYVASIIARIAELDAKVVGIDLLFKNYTEKEEDTTILARTIAQAVSERRTWFIFAAYKYGGEWLKPLPEITNPNWSLLGDINLFIWAMRLGSQTPDPSSESPLPLSYNLALAYRLNERFPEEVPQPDLRSTTDFFSQISEFSQLYLGEDYTTVLPKWSHSQKLTRFAYKLRQTWFHPIIDFSIPPTRAYQIVPAWKLLESDASTPELQAIDRQVVVLVPGGFGEAGLFAEGQDNHKLPPAIAYWHDRTSNPTEIFTGGEAHAYMIHHLLRDRLVVPVPDLWVVAAAILLGKGAIVVWKQKHRELGKTGTAIARSTIALAPIVYGAASLQLFVSAAILLPWVLPSAAFWIYALPALLRKKTV